MQHEDEEDVDLFRSEDGTETDTCIASVLGLVVEMEMGTMYYSPNNCYNHSDSSVTPFR